VSQRNGGFKIISIIIPTLNEERFLPPLLDAIRQQEADCEVIVVDGGSQDRTLEIARDHGVRTIVSLPGGTGICIGAEEARGEVLFFLHEDSTLLPGALDRINEVLAADAKAAATTPVQQMGVVLARNSPIRVSLPRFHYRVGLHIVLFEVCSAFTRVAACTTRTITVCRDRDPKASDTSSPPCLLRSLPAGAVAGWGLHPLEKRRLVTAHVEGGYSHQISARLPIGPVREARSSDSNVKCVDHLPDRKFLGRRGDGPRTARQARQSEYVIV
jgi:Glycosyl transferase family 2